ncbi:hypothetical protein KDN24_04580 [Bacillus sp. Bva_UNVM-123]|uniref:hypothetical protein n=1 Tax=Bacillus sp. Bva_UNVM-123 TaxID=2829798 RepID=UPI00391F467E
MMRILLYEIRKAFLSPIIIALTIIFIGFNSFLIYENAYIQNDLRDVNEIAAKYGTEIDQEMLEKMKNDYEAKMKKVNEGTTTVLAKSYQNMNEFFTDGSFYLPEKFSEKEIQFFNETALLEFYYFTSQKIDEDFLAYDPIKIAEKEIWMYGIDGKAAEFIRSHYGKFTDRYEEVLQNKEYKQLFPAQAVFDTHLLLFKTLFKAMLIESVILTVLVTAYVMNYEFERGTYLLSYSSKRGRTLWVDKLFAVLITNILNWTMIWTISLVGYFTVFSYREFWHVPISSLFNAGKEWFMSWWNLSFAEYLAAAVLLAYLLIVIFTFMTVIMTRWIRNSYLVFFTFLCMFGVIFVNQALFSTSNILFLFGYFTPINLVLNSFIWFMQRALTFTAYFEIITITIWLLVLLLGVMYCAKSFRKSDLA